MYGRDPKPPSTVSVIPVSPDHRLVNAPISPQIYRPWTFPFKIFAAGLFSIVNNACELHLLLGQTNRKSKCHGCPTSSHVMDVPKFPRLARPHLFQEMGSSQNLNLAI